MMVPVASMMTPSWCHHFVKTFKLSESWAMEVQWTPILSEIFQLEIPTQRESYEFYRLECPMLYFIILQIHVRYKYIRR